MRIVTRSELMAMPAGTLFCQWEPCVFGDLAIKGETCGTDFYVQHFPQVVWDGRKFEDYSDALYALDGGQSMPLDLDCEGREGFFDDTMRYAVMERDDVIALRNRLDASLRLAYRPEGQSSKCPYVGLHHPSCECEGMGGAR